MENIVLFFILGMQLRHNVWSNKTNSSVHPIHPTLSMSGTSGSLLGKGGWCHLNTIGGLSDLIPDPVCVFTTRRMPSRGPDHLRVLSFDLIPRLTGGENSDTVSPQLWLCEEIPLDVCRDEVKTVPRTLEIIVISSGVAPNKNTACLTTSFKLPLGCFGFLDSKQQVTCCSLRSPGVSARTILLCRVMVCHSHISLPAFLTEMEVAAGLFLTFPYKGEMTGRQG